MRYVRFMLILLLAILCGWFVVQFYLMITETNEIWASCEKNHGFSCDAFSTHMVGGFHVLAFVLLPLVIFARKYFWAFGIGIAYLFIDIFGTYARVGTGFFGGDTCPGGHPCIAAIRRASAFDWSATLILLVAVILTSSLLVKHLQSPRFP